MPSHKRAIAQLDDLFCTPVPTKKQGSVSRDKVTTQSRGSSKQVNGNDRRYAELPHLMYREPKCRGAFLDGFLKNAVGPQATGIVHSKVKNKVLTLQNQVRSRRTTATSKSTRAASLTDKIQRKFDFAHSKLGSRKLRKGGIKLGPTESDIRGRLTPDHCKQMHMWWHDYALATLQEHNTVNMCILLAEIELHGAHIVVTKACADPMLVGIAGTILHETQHMISVYNPEAEEMHFVPKNGTTIFVMLDNMAVHIDGSGLVDRFSPMGSARK